MRCSRESRLWMAPPTPCSLKCAAMPRWGRSRCAPAPPWRRNKAAPKAATPRAASTRLTPRAVPPRVGNGAPASGWCPGTWATAFAPTMSCSRRCGALWWRSRWRGAPCCWRNVLVPTPPGPWSGSTPHGRHPPSGRRRRLWLRAAIGTAARWTGTPLPARGNRQGAAWVQQCPGLPATRWSCMPPCGVVSSSSAAPGPLPARSACWWRPGTTAPH